MITTKYDGSTEFEVPTKDIGDCTTIARTTLGTPTSIIAFI